MRGTISMGELWGVHEPPQSTSHVHLERSEFKIEKIDGDN